MYVLLIILGLSGTGKALSTSQIEFSTKKLCEEAKTQVEEDTDSFDRKTVLCLKVK